MMLEILEQKLSTLSHSEEAIGVIEQFCSEIKGTQARINLLNQANAIIRSPIEFHESQSLGFNQAEDAFTVLQGDVIRTESAFRLGERVTGKVAYVVLNSSCDLVLGRKQTALLLPISEILRGDPAANRKLGELVKFSRRDAMYLPPLFDDSDDVVGNSIQFDGVCQIETKSLHIANRVASLSLIGWRIFASFSRIVFARANPREVEIRLAVEKRKSEAA